MTITPPRDTGGKELGRIAIIGSGQVGTMLGIGLRAAGCGDVVVHDRDPSVAATSAALGAASGVITDNRDALAYDTIIVALPVPEIVKTIGELGPRMTAGTFLVDTGSAKVVVTDAMRRHVPRGVHAVGGHPMAGSEQPGPRGARPGMLKGAPFIFTPARDDPAALDRGRSLAAAVGAEMFELDPGTHDALLARTSHLAHLVAFALRAVGTAGSTGAVHGLTSAGYDGMTRLAGSSPEMVAGFLGANAANVTSAVEELITSLQHASKFLGGDPAGLSALLAEWQTAAPLSPALSTGTRP
ncbi:MAG: prephenate dehydrogenase [Actinomycetota bacterium]|nr:prephenate dehydrogenase [Actinomycetota bacterium]